ncbi:MAG TPA: hypothetical protein IAC71_00135 [Candidatus Caccomonas pullistercoris]|nr:hypothetical protein [Candidatus Caccomonas pullistercoris]
MSIFKNCIAYIVFTTAKIEHSNVASKISGKNLLKNFTLAVFALPVRQVSPGMSVLPAPALHAASALDDAVGAAALATPATAAVRHLPGEAPCQPHAVFSPLSGFFTATS